MLKFQLFHQCKGGELDMRYKIGGEVCLKKKKQRE